MANEGKYLVVGLEKFHQDLRFLRRQANTSPVVYRHLYREVLREIESDPSRKLDYRLVFREVGPQVPGGQPRRELPAIKPRTEQHLCTRLCPT